jgi:hypothetical protein
MSTKYSLDTSQLTTCEMVEVYGGGTTPEGKVLYEMSWFLGFIAGSFQWSAYPAIGLAVQFSLLSE